MSTDHVGWLVLDSSLAIRIPLATLNFLIALAGISGNIFVLHASIANSALKIDRISVVYLESLAVSDILMSISVYLTTGITILARRWIFGKEFCYFTKIATMSAAYNETLAIAFLSIYRVWMLRKPPSARQDINMKLVYVLAASLHFVGVGVVLLIHAAHPQWNILGNPAVDNCSYADLFIINVGEKNATHGHKSVSLIPTIAFVVVPMLITVGTTALIFKVFLGYDHKMGRKHDRALRVIKLLLFVCVTFVLSYTALIISSLYNTFRGSSPPVLRGIVNYFLAINVISNPFIYVVISPHFRGYLRQCGRRFKSVLKRRKPSVDLAPGAHSSTFRRHSTFNKSGNSEDMVTNNVVRDE
ncbi:hypothetical protein ACHWQZ_G012119 [Mnemiopsis leidyi]